MNNEILNITNGDYFNEYFISRYGGIAIPFCEAMMDGETVEDIYSDEFIALRAKSLNVSEDEYRGKMHVHDSLKRNSYKMIRLWFGRDTFCQVNLLTLLAYLEQIGYREELKLNYVDDETCEVLESDIDVKLGIYGKMYRDVLISKTVPSDVGVLSARAMDLFLDYRSADGKLTRLVRANVGKERVELIGLLLEESRDYGLSDLQAERLINYNTISAPFA